MAAETPVPKALHAKRRALGSDVFVSEAASSRVRAADGNVARLAAQRAAGQPSGALSGPSRPAWTPQTRGMERRVFVGD